MEIQYVVGDATKPQGNGTKVIAHICNDVGGWGRGFVLAVSERWPMSSQMNSPEYAYREWHKKKKWKDRPFVLGQIQTMWVENTVFVCNMIAQRDHRPLYEGDTLMKLPNCNLTSLRECLTRLLIQCEEGNSYEDTSVHMPRIGAGLGGETWDRVSSVINSVFKHSKVPVYIYDLQPQAANYITF